MKLWQKLDNTTLSRALFADTNTVNPEATNCTVRGAVRQRHGENAAIHTRFSPVLIAGLILEGSARAIFSAHQDAATSRNSGEKEEQEDLEKVGAREWNTSKEASVWSAVQAFMPLRFSDGGAVENSAATIAVSNT